MPDGASPEAERGTARPGRCSVHPGAPQVGICSVCRRALCMACAIPVRGTLVGRECLGSVLEDPPPAQLIAPPPVPRGSGLTLVGFGAILVLSVFPWSRFGDASGFLQAWTSTWSLLAVVAAAAGLTFTVVMWRHPIDLWVEAAVEGALALAAGVGAYLHFLYPPPLSSPSVVPLLSVLAAGLALAGAAIKAVALLQARRGVVTRRG